MAKNQFLSILNKVKVPKPNKSVFDLSYSKAGTMRFGEVVPTYVEHVVPGDVFELGCSAFVRMDPLSAPIMGNIQVDTFYFYVPFRILWEDFEKFITGGRLGVDEPIMPYFKATSGTSGSSYLESDRLLLQLKQSFYNSSTGHYYIPKSHALALRGYWKIIDEYFRDQNLMQSYFDPDSGTPILNYAGGEQNLATLRSNNLLKPFNAAWSKDIFTSALPFPQRGASVGLPVEGVIDYKGSNNSLSTVQGNTDSEGNLSLVTTLLNNSGGNLIVNDLMAFSIEDLREANVIQRWLEISAISGNRYKEAMLAHYGVDIKDSRLQRPEYLCGMSTDVMVSQVTQQSQTTDDSVLGDYAGHGLAAGTMQRRNVFCPEHGLIMGLSCIRPRAQYSQGINRNFLKEDKFDFYFPEFQNLGEQEIYKAELFATGSNVDRALFGYGPRYYEYKMRHNEIFGDLATSLSFWTPQRFFSSVPALNSDFVTVNPATEASLNNIFAVTDSGVDPFKVVFQNHVKAIRPMNKWSNFSLM